MSTESQTPPSPVGTRTIHFGLRVSDRGRSLDFYRSLGYEVVGTVPETEIGHLTMLKLPGDEFVTIELVADPPDASPPGLSHIVVTVNSLNDSIAALWPAQTAHPTTDYRLTRDASWRPESADVPDAHGTVRPSSVTGSPSARPAGADHGCGASGLWTRVHRLRPDVAAGRPCAGQPRLAGGAQPGGVRVGRVGGAGRAARGELRPGSDG
jgi:catechol 2,3-dioxygenase-like lactoylglutathione lyase family enzyme